MFAPNAKARPALKTLVPASAVAAEQACGHTTTDASPDESTADSTDPPMADKEPVPHKYRRTWHDLLRRVFDINLVCELCGAKMHRISHIEDPATIGKILGHLGLPSTAPAIAPARAPPQFEFFD